MQRNYAVQYNSPAIKSIFIEVRTFLEPCWFNFMIILEDVVCWVFELRWILLSGVPNIKFTQQANIRETSLSIIQPTNNSFKKKTIKLNQHLSETVTALSLSWR